MIDKMKNKMSGWEAYSLSFAGRVTLAQASLANITGYVMQTCAIPISVCEEAAKLCRNFIRGSTTDQRKCHLIYLSKMCLPKEEGGLGFRDLKVLNKAYMMKLAWCLAFEPEKLWVKIMKAKYNCGAFAMPQVEVRHSCYNVWRAIVDIWPAMESNIFWCIGNGNSVHFWKDKWIPGSPNLEEACHGNIPQDQVHFLVSFYVNNNWWNWESFNSFLPSSISDRIALVASPGNSVLANSPCWSLNSDGMFSLKSAYQLLRPSSNTQPELEPLFEKAWHWKGHIRLRAFLWKLVHGKLLTNVERNRRGMSTDSMCPRCNSCPEIRIHNAYIS